MPQIVERPTGQWTKRSLTEAKQHIGHGLREFLQDGFRRQQRIATVVALAGENEQPSLGRQSTDLPEILQNNPRDCLPGPLHRRPLGRLVSKQSLFPSLGLGTFQNGMGGD